MLGTREVDIYGSKTLSAIAIECEEHASGLGFMIDFRQSNHEGEMLTIIQESKDNFAGIIINAAAYSHTSIALLDVLKLVQMPIIEVHLSNIFKREEFREFSYISKVATGIICGLGSNGYILALDALKNILENKD